MSIEAQLEQLNQNIQTLVGAIAANTSVAAALASVPAAPAPAAEKPAKATKTKAAPAPAAAPEAAKPAAEPVAETPQVEEDPFGEADAPAPAPTYTIDDVREAALALRDATSMDKAKEFIAGFGVASIKDLPEAKFAEFVQKANKAADR